MTRVAREWFERAYAEDPDPWGMATRAYERRKYALTVASLPEERYRSGFEPGCSLGVLSVSLASRCDRLLSVDHVAPVVAAAARRLRPFPHVHVERRDLPEAWPEGPFDLLVLSELGYYFDAGELEVLEAAAWSSLDAGATVVAVHWRHRTDYPLSGDEVHAALDRDPHLRSVAHHVEDDFLLDVWRFGE